VPYQQRLAAGPLYSDSLIVAQNVLHHIMRLLTIRSVVLSNGKVSPE
jgi:hypothetical protein